MRTTLKVIARIVSAIGMFAVAALPAVWASGSLWPAKNHKRLGEAVVGQSKGLDEVEVTRIDDESEILVVQSQPTAVS